MNTPFTVHVVNPYYQQAIGEHRDLLAETFHLRSLFHGCVQNRPDEKQTQELTRLLRNLNDHLSRHFRQEQAGGYLEEAIVRLPRIGPRAEVLQRQHAELSGAAGGLVEQMADLEPATCDWARMAWEFDQFVHRLATHEAAENALLHEAFNENPTDDYGG